MNYVDEEMDFPWPTEPPRDSDESREKDMGPPFEYQLHLATIQQQQQPPRAKKSMFKKLTGMFRSNNTSPTTPPVPLPSSSDDASTPSFPDSNGPIDPYANILSSAAGIPDPLLTPPPPSPFIEPRKSSSSSRSLFLNGLFTRSQETLTPPPSKKERNVLRKKGSASSLRAMRNGNGNGSTTSLAKSVKEVTKKKSGLAMEIKVPPPPQLSQRPPDLVLSPTTPDYRDEDITTSTPTPSSLPATPTSPSSLSKSPSTRRPPRPLASLPPAPPSPTFPPPPPPPFQHSELPPRRDSLLLPPSPSSPYLSSFPQPPPSPPSVRVQHPSPEKPPSLTSSSSSSGGVQTTTTTPSDSIDNGRGPPHHHIKSTVLPRLKDPFKQIRYRDDILSSEDPELLLSDMEVGISRNWTTFANESTERFRAAVGSSEEEDGDTTISMISNEGGGKGKKGHKIGKLSNKPTSEKPKPSLFRKRHPPSPLTLSPSLSTYSSSSALPSPLLLTPPAPHSPIRPLVQALEDIDIEDVENDTVPKGNYHYNTAKTTEQLRGGGRVVVARRFDL